MSTFWRDLKRGWNVASRTATRTVRDLGEKFGLGGEEDAERRAARAEVDGWRPSASGPRATTSTGAPRTAAPPSPLPSPPLGVPGGPDRADLTEPELEDRIRRRTL